MSATRTAFAPRFETTRNWARQLAPFSPGPDDLSFDPARDLPLAQNLLERAGLGAQREVLASALVESARNWPRWPPRARPTSAWPGPPR